MTRTLSREHEAEVERRAEAVGVLDALAYVHRSTGMGFAEAIEVVQSALTGIAPRGLCAELLATGRYHPDLAPHLDYPTSYYAQTRSGAKLLVCLFAAFDPELMESLAECAGVDPWDFNTYAIDPSQIRFDVLRNTFSEYESEFAALVAKFVVLRDAGFRFYFHVS